MKNLITLLFILLGINVAYCQLDNVGIGTTAPDSSAILDITSIDKGVLLPRMDSTDRKDIINPKDGLILYDSTTYSFWFFRDTIWTEFNWLPNDNLGDHLATQNLDMSEMLINNLGEPLLGSDAANKTYVDNVENNLLSDINNIEADIQNVYDVTDNNASDIANLLSITDNHIVSITNNSNAINNHTTNDTDLSPTNELQTLSISDQELTLSSGNTITLPMSSGVFENNGGVIRNTGANTDDFIFGESQLPVSGAIVDDQLFFFDESKGAFRAGRLNSSNVWGTDKIGNQSIAMGINTEASGLNSTSIGQNTIASGDKSIAMGNSSTATAENALAIGSFNDATGNSSVALGANSNAIGNNAVALGLGASAQGDESLSTGNDTKASGLNSTAMGFKSEGNGAYSTAMGWQSKANADQSIAMGIGTRADAYGSLAFGRYNEGLGDGISWVETDPILEIGIGATSLTRENAMTILKNGTVSFKEYSFPNVDGTTGQVLETDGNGIISWTSPTTGADDLGNHMATQDLDLDGQRIINLDDPTLDGDAATKFYVDLHTDADSDASNELQVLSISNDTIYLSAGGFAKLPSTGIFENNSGVVRNTGADTDDFIFGEDALPLNGQLNTGEMFFFDKDKAAFRAGQLANSNSWNPDSLGLASVAMGNGARASGEYAIAMGSGARATASRSVALGRLAKATGFSSFAAGDNIEASGSNAVAIGNSSQAEGDHSVALGSINSALGDHSFTVGNFNIAAGDNSTALGILSHANGLQSTAVGAQTEANGFYSTAMGRLTKADANNVFVIGRYNVGGGTAASWIATEPVFEIGIGDPNLDENAMTVRKDGLVSFKEYSFPNVDGSADQVLATDGNGIISWADDQSAFENNSGVVRNTGADTDDFIFGEDALPLNGQLNTGEMFFFDKDKAAFRAGQLANSNSWNPDSLGLASVAMGNGAKASGEYAIAMGSGARATASRSVALGRLAQATGFSSFAAGDNIEASGSNAVAIGNSSQAEGDHSVALGSTNSATGDHSFTVGNFNIAAGDNSTALGVFSHANGLQSTAIGAQTVANGFYSTAMGRLTKADANNVFVIGRYNVGGGTAASWIATEPVFEIGIGDPNLDENAMTVRKDGLVSFKEYSFPNVDGSADQVLATDGSGNISWASNQGAFENSAGLVRNSGSDTDDFIFGEDALPINGVNYSGEMFYFDKGKFAFRAGKLSNTTDWSPDSIGIASVAMGEDVKATGNHSIALGKIAAATGTTSFAAGTFTNATATGSVAIGYSNDAIAANSIAMGRYSEASGLTALAIGDHVDATGQSSVAFGFYTEANGEGSFSMGVHSDANGQYSTSIGHRLGVQSYNNTALGRYNDDSGDPINWVDTDPLFQVGNGTSYQDKSNAFTIYKNGVTEITDSLYTDGNIRIGDDDQSRLYLGNVFMQSGNSSALRMDGSIGPYVDDTYSLGSSSFRWNDVWATNGVIQTSDERLKKNIVRLNYGLDQVLAINPVSYHWNKEDSEDKKHVGLIAQELREIIPEVVNEEGEYLGVKYAELVPVLIQAIKDQQNTITEKSNRITNLESELGALSTEVNSIMYRLSKIEKENLNGYEKE